MAVGIYVHIPFCRQKCCYCDFPSYGGISHYMEPYVNALCRELDASDKTGIETDSIYLGGGTPSLLSTAQVGQILGCLSQRFLLTRDTEITLEVNPDSFDRNYAEGLLKLGVNRISIGIQSFQPQLLTCLGRIHTAGQAVKAVQAAAQAGFMNVSADLMYGLPGQTEEMLSSDLEQLLSLPLCHASVYSLILEKGTRFWHDVQRGMLCLPDDDTVQHMADMVHQAFLRHGFEHYEISSYARPGRRSRHNVKYWRYEPYISFGVSAHSFYHDVRAAHIANIPEYIRKAGKSSVWAERIAIDKKRAEEDYCFLALRMRDGLDFSDFRKRFDTPIETAFGPVLELLYNQGLLEQTIHGCRLTALGLSYGNYVFSRFIR